MVAEKLASLGYEVRQDDDVYRAMSPFERRRLAAQVADAACVVVLWSRDGLEAPALQAAAQAAKAQGKLALARLDASAPPSRMGGQDIANLAQWYGLDEARGWRDLLEAVTTKTKPAGKKPAAASRPVAARAQVSAAAATPEKKKSGAAGLILVLLVLLAAGGGAAYAYLNGLIPLG
jgi:hypothetical protein